MRFGHLPVVKICCISSREEARIAVAAGASALGLVSSMPNGPGQIDDELIAEIAAVVPPPVATFLLTCKQDAAGIVRFCRTTTLQLVDRVAPDELRRIRKALPGTKIVQAIHVTGRESVDEAKSVCGFVDALLLDSGDQELPVKQLGGTGRTHDWMLSRQIRNEVSVSVFLAGGISAVNVEKAVFAVRPFGLDLCSSVRSDGILDESKLKTFFSALGSIPSRQAKP